MIKDNFNFIPNEYLMKEKMRQQEKMVKILIPIIIALLIFPAWLLYSGNNKNQQELDNLYEEQIILKEEIRKLEDVEIKIADIENKINVFSNLMSNSYKRTINIKNIEKYIPSEITYSKITLVFSDYRESKENEIEENIDIPRVKIYENIPNIMVIEGRTKRLDAISRFVYKLNKDPLIEIVNMEEIGWLEKEKMNSFLIAVEIKDGDLK